MLDVCFVLEGTYPYRVGGVSSWTHSLITGLPDITFSVAHLFAGAPPACARFPRPANLGSVQDVALDGALGADADRGVLSGLAARLPRARLYHALSTGYAGLIGAAAARRHSVPFLLTEHGLYWREAEQGGEFECGVAAPQSAAATRTWVARLREYARCAYDAADVITAVCDANRALQLSLGAEPARSVVIANGVEVPGAQVCARPAGDRGVLRVGLVGRVTPIKGTTTFLEACRVVQGAVARAEFYVVGPGDHSPEYDAECRQLAHRLRLERVTFTGEVDVRDWYPRLDVVVLTSRSEAQPLALLEAMAYGRPVVATDVGGCRELVEGPADAFGAAGVVCPPGDAGAVARAIVRVGARPEHFAQAGRARVAALYTRRRMLDRYRALYGRLLSGAAGPRRPSNGPAPAPAQRVPATSG